MGVRGSAHSIKRVIYYNFMGAVLTYAFSDTVSEIRLELYVSMHDAAICSVILNLILVLLAEKICFEKFHIIQSYESLTILSTSIKQLFRLAQGNRLLLYFSTSG